MDTTLLHGVFILLLLISALFALVLGLILAYHWEKFAMNAYVSRMAILIYTCVTFVLLAAMAALIPA